MYPCHHVMRIVINVGWPLWRTLHFLFLNNVINGRVVTWPELHMKAGRHYPFCLTFTVSVGNVLSQHTGREKGEKGRREMHSKAVFLRWGSMCHRPHGIIIVRRKIYNHIWLIVRQLFPFTGNLIISRTAKLLTNQTSIVMSRYNVKYHTYSYLISISN